MKVKFDGSVPTNRLGVNSKQSLTFKATTDRTRRKGILERAREAAMTIVGSLIPSQWDSMWHRHQNTSWGLGPMTRSSFDRWGDSRGCTACASPDRGLYIYYKHIVLKPPEIYFKLICSIVLFHLLIYL